MRPPLSLLSLVLTFVACSAACRDAADGPLLDPRFCVGAWQAITDPQPDFVNALTYHEGTLFYASSMGIFAQPVAGGPPTQIGSDYASRLTVEDGRLIYHLGGQREQFVALPIGGGSKDILFDFTAGDSATSFFEWNAVTATDIYFTERASGSDVTTVRDLRRADGKVTLLASVAAPAHASEPFTGIGLTDDGVLISDRLTASALVPFDGGMVRELASPSQRDGVPQFVGSDRTGVYWQKERWGSAGGDERADLDLSPADGGGLRAFWDLAPPATWIERVEPDGKGGWILLGLQSGRDGVAHAVAYAYDGRDDARLLACAPQPLANLWLDSIVAVAPDAVYVVATNSTSPLTWQIVRIALP